MKSKVAQWTAVSSLLALIILCLGWELWWAPLRQGGSFLALKALPLLLPLRGLLYGRRYTMQWTSLFILLWLAEGLMRAWSDQGLSQGLAAIEVFLVMVCFIAVSLNASWTAPSKKNAPQC